MEKLKKYDFAYEQIMRKEKSMDRDLELDSLLLQMERDLEIIHSDAKIISWYQKVIAAKSL
ncbi:MULTISPECIES: hypothetical protein [unclassified Exiguobacterium]|uniref:hypothetical protein n=1 Tax=unclassified Exiguobacterium TaxID=2644629 RepID=UPI001BED2846|nr:MULTISPECIES: hypothetical protein [unclassified Exiguobacterium]